MEQLRDLTWEEIKPVWDHQLWPGRDSEPVTSMKYLGGYDMSLKSATPHFIGLVTDDYILAVNSFVQTGDTEWRSRGLWVDPSFRAQGHSKDLLIHMLDRIREQGGTMVWTMPRDSALVAYESAGFIRTSDWMKQDWGTNCYALASLRSIESFAQESARYRERRIQFSRDHIEPMIREGCGIEEMRRAIRPLAEEEERDWR